jgi:hypothetical protein
MGGYPTNLLDAIHETLPGCKRYNRADGSSYLAGICPWHEDSRPSLLVHEDNFFRCLACGRMGDHQTLLNELRRPGFTSVQPTKLQWDTPKLPETIKGLQAFLNKCHYDLVESEYLQTYIKQRGVEGRLETNRLGFHRGWYTIPVFNQEGAIHGAVLRSGPQVQKISGLRFVVPFGQKPMLYVPDWRLFENASKIAIVFGMFDALALADLRHPVCTTTSGKDSFDEMWLHPFKKMFVIIPDQGEEGTAHGLAKRLSPWASVQTLPYPEGCKDPADFLATGRREELDNLLRRIL